ncbi:MAG: methionine gamma-lyase family protein [Candidatus Paraimprobicoccus trichonymphae]|uniref:Methionine gamma-lyase family protein n=1 Tax=Candidatus Paraimprobicoccus trichonymphae TaxID=3033793 RepID=A0AA48I574_9FIRM|nr:MAG: methionine gamma-lyase family protein [Candidatus Paraimprobicoccus trichonymphae]
MRKCKTYFQKVEEITEFNQQRVLKEFINLKVSESHFSETTGYGYDDIGRKKLEELFSKVFNTEDSLVRHSFASGTHAINTALFGVLRPGDKILCVTGKPYETLYSIIKKNQDNIGSLKDFKIDFEYVNLDYKIIKNKICKNKFKVFYVQRSYGYNLKEILDVCKIEKLINFLRLHSPNSIIILDNCYGEFVEKSEPNADLMVGSLIKNPGGGIATSGAYISGKKNLIKLCSYRFTSPGIGKEIGASLNQNRKLFMGLFNSPHVVGEAMKTMIFTACIFELLDFEVYPKYNSLRTDIIQSIKFKNKDLLVKFCQNIQKNSPVDSFVVPEAWNMPGYDCKVIMASGSFTSGSSIELSVDAPIKKPYIAFLQGGLNFHSAKFTILRAISETIYKKY